MKFISWNVNGFRALQRKMDVGAWLKETGAEALCIQETKLQRSQVDFQTSEYLQFWNDAERKGYSGTAIFTRRKPINATYGIGIEEHDHEGRVITLEYEDFYLVTVYTPNTKRDLSRLSYRMEWGKAFTDYIKHLDADKPVIFCGDLNVAHQPIDLKNAKSNEKNAGFTIEERSDFSRLLDAGFTDSFRYLHPKQEGAYSWWSFMAHARQRNIGWRIDYFVVSNRLRSRIRDAKILSNMMGSDHCPVELDLA
ncbi:exodeoxyribonuclease III [Sporolactobacillus sp. THM19-2]|uniref:exodeoxyribonuclease III n=1 Tax=Sporolactobacillus sp. THM19-2 TaxID=2511171 RepID=UPI001020C98F|nr:exodeoxyribonuclease III [Sporolactobacillus sp. THM19-2]RYL86519.1 exodeoxyribonuclease III [Sporolactobacillus sp. THM19-2]